MSLSKNKEMRGEPTMQELQGLAARQRLQLDNQARLIAAREQRLRQVMLFCGVIVLTC